MGERADMPASEDAWKKRLDKQQYHVLREKGTEIPFTGKYVHTNEKGMYACAGCGAELFASNTKFESGTGWPSFYDVANSKNIVLEEDTAFGVKRIEVKCRKCGGHLGHVFDDGPFPTKKRYCINSCSLDFKKENTHETTEKTEGTADRGTKKKK